MPLSNNQQVLLALVRGGLWETEVPLKHHDPIDFAAVARMAEAHGVLGLLAAGLEHSDVKVSQKAVLNVVGTALQIEQRNDAMSKFTADAVTRMQEEGLHPLLVKGQGLAQCYERPQWRASGDIDFFFSQEEYPKAVDFFTAWSGNVVQNSRYTKSYGVVIEPWFIEVHGTLRSTLSSRQSRVIDEVQADTFENRKFRVWKNGNSDIYLPEANNDLFFVYTHFVRHFYKEGCVLRQICDWCRLLWTYRDEIDEQLLIGRLQKAGLMEEWKAFAALAVDNLGMPAEAMPLFSEKYTDKGQRLINRILDGNTGNKLKDTLQVAKIFPLHTLRFSLSIFFHLNWLKIKERLFGNGNRRKTS